MSEQIQQNRILAFAAIFALFFVWSQNTMNPFADHISKGPAQQGQQGQAPAPLPSGQTAPLQIQSPAATNAQANQPAVENQSAPTQASDAAAMNKPAVQNTNAIPSDSQINTAGVYKIENEKFQASISSLGGRLISLKLKNYRQDLTDGSGNYQVVSHTDGYPYPLGVYRGANSDASVQYKVQASTGFSAADDGSLTVNNPARLVLSGELAPGQTLTKTFSFKPAEFGIGVEAAIAPAPEDNAPLELEISKYVPESDHFYSEANSGVVHFDGQAANRELFSAIEPNSPEMSNVLWSALSETYFSQVLKSEAGAVKGRTREATGLIYSRLSQGPAAANFTFYGVPKDYDLLSEVGGELHRTVDFGWAGFLSAPLLSLLHMFNKIFSNYGVAIVVLTILVKLALYPLNAAQFKSMKAMQKLQPEMKRIRENVKDKQEQQMQLMQLYQKAGVNPLGGCLPMVLQLPIFLGLYFGLMADFGARHAPFGFWIQDLSAKEVAFTLGGIGIPILVVLMMISMVYMTATTPSTMEPAQKKIMMFMPIPFGFIFAQFAAGLTLYWLTNNIISVGQNKGMYSDTPGQGMKYTLTACAGCLAMALFVAILGN